MNERVKSQALGQLAGFTGRFAAKPPFGEGFSTLFGAGLQGILRSGYGSNQDFLGKIDEHKRRADRLMNFQFPLP